MGWFAGKMVNVAQTEYFFEARTPFVPNTKPVGAKGVFCFYSQFGAELEQKRLSKKLLNKQQ